jgi:hypothetical protein
VHSIWRLAAAAAFVLAGLTVTGVANAGTVPLVPNGVVNVKALPTATSTSSFSTTDEFKADQESEAENNASSKFKRFHGRKASLPTPTPNSVAGADSALGASWLGLDHYDQRTANNGNQFSLEPPDQGLCAGGGFVVEPVNDVLMIYDTSGAQQLPNPVDLNTFFGLPAAIDRSTGVSGPFLSDPKCYYDTDTQRWFLTELEEDATGVRAHTLIAVSKTSDPTGDWNRYSIDATDDGQNGTPSHPNCPCFGDQPLIGADANGFYITTNEFGDVQGFNGSQVYAMSKSALEGGFTPVVVQFDNLSLAEGQAYSLQPATSPSAGDYDTSNGGTEYFLSALDFNATLDNRIAAWAIANTGSLASSSPSISLQNVLVKSENYGQPPAATQKSGPNPFGEIGANLLYGGATDQPIETLNTNDDRMNQAVYAGGELYGGVNTVVGQGDATLAGVAWFKVRPNAKTHGTMNAHMDDQGYYAPAGNNVLFPSIGVTPGGQKAVIAFTLSGPDYYPSSAYAVLGSPTIHVASPGVGPEDGFTGYDPFADDGIARWGDYSAAVADGGTVWIANEYIAQQCDADTWQEDMTCGGTRTALANWATRVSAVHP